MITALMILFTAAISFALGVKVATARAKRIMDEIEDDYLDDDDYGKALRTFADVIVYECPEGHAGIDELCDLPGVWVCVERINFAHEIRDRGYDYVVSGTASPADPGAWHEVGIDNKCGSGCKIYLNANTGTKILWHNSNYGCKL